MNYGFRNLLGRRDTTKFKAYMLAIAVQMVTLPFLHYFGLIRFNVPAFYPLGAILGGFLFGVAMNWSGGCPAGVWYKLGGGGTGAFAAITGLISGYSSAETGFLQSLRQWIQSPGNNDTLRSASISSLAQVPLWWITLPVSILLLILLFRSPAAPLNGGWRWQKTGLWVGGIGVAAWISSSLSGRFFGMAIMPGSKESLDLLAWGNLSTLNWDLFFVLGIPIGAYLAAQRDGSFKWSSISGAAIWKLAGGGFLLGASASLAGGCTVGHGLAGIPLLSVGSIVFTVSAILGAWMGVILESVKAKT